MGNYSIRNEEAIREVFTLACARNELMILVTPYLRFESSFLRLEQDAVHVMASMSREDATFGLQSPNFRIRFPHGFSFVEGTTRLLGFGEVRGRKSLRLSIPKSLEEDDQRGCYRVERVGRVGVTFSTRKYAIISGTLVNMSTTGARIHSLKEFEEDEMLVEDTIAIAIPLTDAIQINTRAKVRYAQGRSVGLEFRPLLEGRLLESLSRWVFQRREEERERLAMAQVSTTPEAHTEGLVEAGCLILVSASLELEAQAKALLSGLPPLRRVLPQRQALKDILVSRPSLFIFHIQGTGLDDRRHMKALTESLGGRWPFMILGTGDLDSSALFEIGNEAKALSTYLLGPNPTGYFQRLLQGILNRLRQNAEDPTAPKNGAEGV